MNTNNKFIKNPYIVGQKIDEKEQLYGREKIVRKIENNLTTNIKITLLHVQRRIGKTSLITCLPQFFTEEKNHFKFVSFSFQGHKHKPIPEILNELAYAIADEINGLPQQVRELVESDNEDNFFQLFLPKVIHEYLSGEKLVLLLDEFDVLGEDEGEEISKGETIFDKLEKAVKQQAKLFAILVFGRPVEDMAALKRFLEKQTPILQKQVLIEVGLLDRQSTNELIVKQAQGKLEYEQGAIDEIYQLSAGHPSLTQILCYHLFESYREKKDNKVSKKDVNPVLDEAMEAGEPVLEGFLKALDENQKLFFRAVAEVQNEVEENLLKTQIKNWQSLKKRLVEEYGFLGKQGTGYKIKVELVRLWLLNNYPLSDEEKQKMIKNSDKETNRIARIFSSVLVLSLIVGTIVITISQVQSSKDNRRLRNDCALLLEEIKAANDEEKQLQVIQKIRENWSRETETLDEKCPYANTLGLDAQYDRLLHRYGQEKINSEEYGEATEVLCEVSDKYEEFSEIQKIFTRWIVNPNRIPNKNNKKKVMKKLIEQNQSPNDCPAYSFKDKRNEDILYEQVEQLNKFYYQEAQTYINNYDFGKAVELYCKITEDYSAFSNVVEQLKEWFYTDDYSDDFYQSDQRIVREKLEELENQCPASPLNNN